MTALSNVFIISGSASQSFHALRSSSPATTFPSSQLALSSPSSSFLQISPRKNFSRIKALNDLTEAFVHYFFRFYDQPWLPSQRNFVPVEETGESVIHQNNIEGEIPPDFSQGLYIRNGSNPQFGALQSACSAFGTCNETWVEGEGMLHALSFCRTTTGKKWSVIYKNRFVESETFRIERRRNRPSILPVVDGNALSVATAVLLNQLRFGKAFKDLSNTNVFEHAGRVFAISENHMPQEIELSSLKTIGCWDLGRAWNRPFISHPKKAPDSGQLVFVGASAKRPFLVLGIVSADGNQLTHKVDLKLERSTLCHDIGVTKRYNIILDMPLTFDIKRLINGGPLIKFEKESYGRIGVMPRYGNANSIRWFDVEPYCTFHIVNCYELYEEVIVIGCRARGSIIPGPDFGRSKYEWFSNGFEQKDCDDEGLFFSRLHEWRLNMRTGGVKERYLSGCDFSVEFPIINDRFVGLYNRFAFTQVVNSETSSVCALPKYGSLAKFYFDEKDGSTLESDGYVKKVERHRFAKNEFCSGAAFVPKQDGFEEEEDAGWLISFVHNESTNTSQVHIIDAKRFEGDSTVVAKITLPRRVPYGFHGAFIPSTFK